MSASDDELDPSQLSDEALLKLLGQANRQQAAKENPEPPRSMLESALQPPLIGLGYGLDRLASGLRDLTPAPLRSVIDAADTYSPNSFVQRASGIGTAAPPNIDPDEQAYRANLMKGYFGDHPSAELASHAPELAAQTPLGMGLLAGLSYNDPQQRAIDATSAAVGGKLGQYAMGGLTRIVQPFRNAAGNAVTDATRALLDKVGVTGGIGQLTDSTAAKWLESAVSSMPGGGALRDVSAGQNSQLAGAALSAMGGSGNALTKDATDAALRTVGQKFDTIPAGVKVDVGTAAVDGSLAAASGKYYYKKLPTDARAKVDSYVNDIRDMAATGMSGEQYQAMRSSLARQSAAASDPDYKLALRDIYKTLDDAFYASAPPGARDAYNTARQQYTTGKTLESLANPDGTVSVPALAGKYKDLPPGTRFLAEAAAKLRPMQSSGTAERRFMQTAVSGLGAGAYEWYKGGNPGDIAKVAAGGLAAPWLIGSTLAAAPVRRYLTNTLVPDAVYKGARRLGAIGGGLLGLTTEDQ